MRSLASALSIKRGKSEDGSVAGVPTSASMSSANAARLAKPRSITLFAKAPKTPVETNAVLRSRPSFTPGSSSSSEGSASLRTPEDDGLMAFPKTDEKKRWSNWFAWRRPSEKASVDGHGGDIKHTRHHSNTPDSRTTHGPHRKERLSTSDTDDDDDESESESAESRNTSAGPPRPALTQATISKAQSNLRTLLRNSLSLPPSPPPLVEGSPSTQFPRSSTSHRNAPFVHTFETSLHTRKMLRRLERRSLTHAEVNSIVAFGIRPQPTDAVRNGQEKKTDDEMMTYASMRVGRYSRGLRNWALRPCFEQRVIVWMPDESGGVVGKNVVGVGRGLAVCDLEFSERVEELAGLALDARAFEKAIHVPPPTPKGSPNKPTPQKPPPSRASPRQASFTSTPSPLRLEHGQPAQPVLSPVSSVASGASASSAVFGKAPGTASGHAEKRSASGAAPGQRGVRFAVDADDDVPLGYAIQAKKKKEEKERFLRAEKERRAKELNEQLLEDRKRLEEEQRRAEEERWAREEQQKAKYAEEVAAARKRRESVRLGAENYTTIRELKEREHDPSYSRPAYDKVPSFTTTPRSGRRESVYAGRADSHSGTGSSPSPSRPPSFIGSTDDVRRSVAVQPVSGPSHSVEDFRARPSHSRRQSGISETSQQQSQSYFPEWSTSSKRLSLPRSQSAPMHVPQVGYAYPVMYPNIPPMPAMPIWNMPLLPPSAPFMMQHYSPVSPSGSLPNSHNNSRDSSPSRHSSGMRTPSQSHAAGVSANGSPRPTNERRHSRYKSSDHHSRQPSGLSNDGSGRDPRKQQQRSASYSPHPPLPSSSSSQRHSRPEQSRQSSHGHSSSPPRKAAPPDPKRRTTML